MNNRHTTGPSTASGGCRVTGHRVRWILGVITRYFFSSPLIHRHIPSKEGVAFDVTRCSFADYFGEQGVPEVTPHGACNLDYGSARE